MDCSPPRRAPLSITALKARGFGLLAGVRPGHLRSHLSYPHCRDSQHTRTVSLLPTITTAVLLSIDSRRAVVSLSLSASLCPLPTCVCVCVCVGGCVWVGAGRVLHRQPVSARLPVHRGEEGGQ
jgi:hypothetical protein